MPQTRFVPGGRIVEEFIPDATDEGYQGFSGDRPQLAVDMFGQINTGDPKIELARRMAAQHHDEVEANANAKARFNDPRFIYGASEQPDSIAAIDRELFQPIRREYGVPEPGFSNPSRLFEIGNTLVQADPHTGASRVVYKPPPTPIPEKDASFITSKDIYGKFATTKMKPSAFALALPTLPEFARTNAFNLAQLGTNAPAFQPAAPAPTARRLRVKGPGNQKGSVLEGTTLPAGWSYE